MGQWKIHAECVEGVARRSSNVVQLLMDFGYLHILFEQSPSIKYMLWAWRGKASMPSSAVANVVIVAVAVASNASVAAL